MPRKHRKAEEIIAKLRQADALISQEQSVADAQPRAEAVKAASPLGYAKNARAHEKDKREPTRVSIIQLETSVKFFNCVQ